MKFSDISILNKRPNVRFIELLYRNIRHAMSPNRAIRWALAQLLTPRLREPSLLPRVPGRLTFHRQIDSGPFRLSAWEWGRGPAVLLLHDWNGQARDLEGFVPPLLDAGYRVIAADLPAHGRSSGTQATLLDWRRAVQSLARYAGPVEAIVAHGLGASAAAWAGESLGVRRMVLLAPPADLTGDLRRQALDLGLEPRQAAQVLAGLEELLGDSLAALELRRMLWRLRTPALLLLGPAGSETRLAAGLALGTAVTWPRIPVNAAVPGTPFQRDPAIIAQAIDFLRQQEQRRPRRERAASPLSLAV
jgi:pimeloyl-ACP methyl ester carboxylesterase